MWYFYSEIIFGEIIDERVIIFKKKKKFLDVDGIIDILIKIVRKKKKDVVLEDERLMFFIESELVEIGKKKKKKLSVKSEEE